MTFPAEDGGAAPSSAQVVGTGLMGASIGLALRRLGWHVTGRDADPARAGRAVEVGALDEAGDDRAAELTFVATPVSAVVAEARAALSRGGIVTDVGSVKASIVGAVASSRFVGGHPMAGSEQEGVEGAFATLFEGSTWVLTPTAATDPQVYARLRAVVSSLGAEVLAVEPERHDDLVALVSHVPHLTAAALMGLAAVSGEGNGTLLRLAAGGFRDMTRVAAGNPGIWPDICAENRDAILANLDRLTDSLRDMRATVADSDRLGLLRVLERARTARVSLPVRAPRPEDVVQVRVPVPDRVGVLAEVTTLAGELGVNIWDLSIVHSAGRDHGVLILVVAADCADTVHKGLTARGYRPSVQPLA